MTTIPAAAARAIAHFEALSSGGALDRSLRVTINFHPDWPSHEGSILETLARHDHYVTPGFAPQSPGPNVHDADERRAWEIDVFGGAYDETPADQCPSYGALNHERSDAGARLVAGSAHLRLAEHVLQRCTFALCNDVTTPHPTAVGTATRFNLLSPDAGWAPTDDAAHRQCIVAHIHGPIDFARDVEAVVLDPAHRGTDSDYEAHLLEAPVQWHQGRKLLAAQLSHLTEDFGTGPLKVGKSIAVDSEINARIIGYAAMSERYDLVHLEQLWQLVARHGTI